MQDVAPILAADQDAMLQHLHLLFGRALTGRVEISGLLTDKTRPDRMRTRFFKVDDLEEAAEYAAELNAEPGRNVYVGSALRSEDVFPGKAADDSDFLRTYAVWADADDADQLACARTAYRAMDLVPPFIVVTGRTPGTRAQLWWPLETPIDDIEVLRATLRGIAITLQTDPKVCTGKQLMRLAGSVSWPKKEDRVLERTEIVRKEGATREFTLEQLHRWFVPRSALQAKGEITDVEVVPTGSLGLGEKIVDGREGYAFRLVRATLRQYIGENGAAPTPDELYREVAPHYLKRVDLVRPGRGPEFLKQKCLEAARAFDAGQIPGMRTLEEAVVGWAQKHDVGNPISEEFEEDAGEPEARTFNLRAWSAAAYEGPAKPIEWLCEGTIPLGTPVLLASMGGLGKSFLALDLALEIAVGVIASLKVRTILGGQVVQGGTAVILSAEDSRDSIHRRLERIDPERRRAGCAERLIVVPLPDIGGPKPLIASDGKSLSLTQAFRDLLAELREIPDLKLVVIDPLQAFVMADINADPAAGQFMWSALATICAVTGATVIVAHHMRKDGSASIVTAEQAREAIRGSTALVDGARLAYALWRAGTDETRDMCTRLDVEFAPERIAFGAVVKANDEADRSVQTYVRQASGLLVDMSARVNTERSLTVTASVAQAIVAEIGRAFEDAVAGRGEGYALSPQSGERQAWRLVQRRGGCGVKEAKDLVEAWVMNGVLQMQMVNTNTKKMALRVIGKLG